MRTLKQVYRFIKNYLYFYKLSKPYHIKIYNAQWGNNVKVTDHWLYQFIYKLNLNMAGGITIFSVNGARHTIDFVKSKYKIFYTAENTHVHLSHWQKYEDLFISKKSINLSLGFDYINHPQYVRFPLWLMYNINPHADFNTVNAICNELVAINSRLETKSQFCSFICRNDYFGDRTKFADLVSQIEHIHYPGNFRHNDDTLVSDYNDNKIEYLKQFKFNLCPENSDSSGYVTEKIFDAIKAGCIPIYWGSENKPEPDILNQNRILFLKLNGDNTEVLQKIKQLNEDENAYREFINQPVFSPNAPEIIYGYFERLEQKLREIIK